MLLTCLLPSDGILEVYPNRWGRERVGRWGNSTAMRRLPLKRLIHARCPTVRETSRQQDSTVPPLPASTPEERRRARTGRRNGGLRETKKKTTPQKGVAAWPPSRRSHGGRISRLLQDRPWIGLAANPLCLPSLSRVALWPLQST